MTVAQEELESSRCRTPLGIEIVSRWSICIIILGGRNMDTMTAGQR